MKLTFVYVFDISIHTYLILNIKKKNVEYFLRSNNTRRRYRSGGGERERVFQFNELKTDLGLIIIRT